MFVSVFCIFVSEVFETLGPISDLIGFCGLEPARDAILAQDRFSSPASDKIFPTLPALLMVGEGISSASPRALQSLDESGVPPFVQRKNERLKLVIFRGICFLC